MSRCVGCLLRVTSAHTARRRPFQLSLSQRPAALPCVASVIVVLSLHRSRCLASVVSSLFFVVITMSPCGRLRRRCRRSNARPRLWVRSASLLLTSAGRPSLPTRSSRRRSSRSLRPVVRRCWSPVETPRRGSAKSGCSRRGGGCKRASTRPQPSRRAASSRPSSAATPHYRERRVAACPSPHRVCSLRRCACTGCMCLVHASSLCVKSLLRHHSIVTAARCCKCSFLMCRWSCVAASVRVGQLARRRAWRLLGSVRGSWRRRGGRRSRRQTRSGMQRRRSDEQRRWRRRGASRRWQPRDERCSAVPCLSPLGLDAMRLFVLIEGVHRGGVACNSATKVHVALHQHGCRCRVVCSRRRTRPSSAPTVCRRDWRQQLRVEPPSWRLLSSRQRRSAAIASRSPLDVAR